MKLYQEIEKICALRILSNSEILTYIEKVTKIGKLDEPKKMGLLGLLLHRLGEIEDRYEVLLSSLPDVIDKRIDNKAQVNEIKKEDQIAVEPPPGTAYLLSDLPERREGVLTPVYKCEVCGKVAKNKLGLNSHMKSHKNK